MSRLYCGVEDEVFFMDQSRLARWFKKKKKRRIWLDKVLSQAVSAVATPKGGITSFWTPSGGLVYAEAGAVEFTTPLIEQGKTCIQDLVESLFAQRAYAVRMKERLEEQGKKVKLEGYSSHYNFTLDPFLDGKDLNQDKRIIEFGNDITQWDKYTADVAYTMVRTLGPAYFILLEDDVSSGFMYRIRPHNRFELCGDFMPDHKQLSAGLAFVMGTMKGIENKIKALAADQPFSEMTDEQILEGMPVVLSDKEIGFKKTRLKPGLLAKKNAKKMAANGTNAILTTIDGDKLSPTQILSAYLGYFREHIERYATKEDMQLLERVAVNTYPLQIDIPGHVKFYHDICEEYLVENLGTTDEEILETHTPQSGTTQAYAAFIQEPRMKVQDTLIEAVRFDWDVLDFKVNGKPFQLQRDQAAEFYKAIQNQDISSFIN